MEKLEHLAKGTPAHSPKRSAVTAGAEPCADFGPDGGILFWPQMDTD
jgi:hypothetical protein